MKRCSWKTLENSEIYQAYHDHEWSIPSYDDHHLFEMFILESFHCGLSWLLILKKRESFRQAFDNFDVLKVATYNEEKIQQLLSNPDIVRNEAKIRAAVSNAKAFIKVQQEFNSFSNYLWGFTDHKVICEPNTEKLTKSDLSDKISKDLKKRGFKFMGTVTLFSYLEAVGVYNHHEEECFKYQFGQ